MSPNRATAILLVPDRHLTDESRIPAIEAEAIAFGNPEEE
jgi:hypothetical protein